MNYERASITELSRACGLSRMAIHHYFPNKQAVFTAVVDRYVFGVQDPANKFGASEGSLADFIDNYLDGIVRTMRQIVGLCAGKTEGGGAVAPNFHYFNLMLQTRRYYPGAERKFEQLYRKTRTYWRKAVQRAAETGEVRPDIDVARIADMFHQIHFGLSFEQAMLQGLDIGTLAGQFRQLYELIRA